MVELSLLYPGTKVKIVDFSEGLSCWAGSMDRYLGSVVTVTAVHDEFIIIEEDVGIGPTNQARHWHWFPDMLDYIVEDSPCEKEFDIATAAELSALFLGGDADG